MSAKEIKYQHPKELEFLFEPWRYKVLHGGRGGTKSWGVARWLITCALRFGDRILCGREVQKSIKQSVHQLLKDQIALLGVEDYFEVLVNEIRCTSGGLFAFTGLSTETISSIKSYEGFDKCWLEEADQITRRSYDILLPTIRKDNSEIIITFNPQLDTDETWVRFIENTPDDCKVVEVGWEDNPWFPEVLEKERQAFLRQVKSGARRQEEYDNIWGGKCKPAVEGAIYADEVAKVLKDGRLCDVPYQSTFPVYTIWDLGWADSMAIVFVQCIAGGIRFIDYIEDSHRTYESYVKQIKAKDYQLGKAWLPHDGKACNPQTGRSPITTLQNLKLDTSNETIPDPGKEEGIRLTRMAFPRFYFDKKKCGPLFNCLRRYARVVSKDTEEPMGTKKDANAHGADAVRYTAVIEPELYERNLDGAKMMREALAVHKWVG